MSLENLFKNKLDLTGWEHYRTKEDYVYEGVPIPGLRQDAYQRTIDGVLISVGIFHYYGTPAYIAWGEKAAHHCGLHAPLSKDAVVLETRISCPGVQPTRSAQGLVTGFILDGKEAFGSGTLVSKIWDYQTVKKFTPLAVALGLVIGWATFNNYPLGSSHAWHEWMLNFMAAFFLLFGGLKLVSIKQFIRAYEKYDVIAKRFPAWGYAYAFFEVGLGILYFTQIALFVANIGVILLLGIASVGIYQKLRTKSGVNCACLGGFFNVPLTWFTLAENILMVGMAIMAVIYF